MWLVVQWLKHPGYVSLLMYLHWNLAHDTPSIPGCKSSCLAMCRCSRTRKTIDLCECLAVLTIVVCLVLHSPQFKVIETNNFHFIHLFYMPIGKS